MQEHGLIRIRMLGQLQVRRADGSLVKPDEWRTGKTTDLLRLLAISNRHPVRPEGLIAKLWPDASPERARNSLRTATSQIRRTVRTPCVVRQLGGIVLQDAWVDSVDFKRLATSAHVAARQGRHERVLHLCRAAESLHEDEFHAYDDDSDWACAEREELRHVRHTMLTDAATSALELEQFRDAADLATEAVQLDRASESAHRVLMRAHAELGEMASALRVFESFRAHLAEELGADPSPQTRELHMSLLRGKGA